jgi:hypothetical protein
MGPVSRAPCGGQAPHRRCADFGYAPADMRSLRVAFTPKRQTRYFDAPQQLNLVKIQIECGHYKKNQPETHKFFQNYYSLIYNTAK